jgi:hypothetical protein
VLVSASYDDTLKLWVEEDDEWVCAQTLAGEAAPSHLVSGIGLLLLLVLAKEGPRGLLRSSCC